MAEMRTGAEQKSETGAYELGAQVGFLLRQAHQRHTALFAAAMPEKVTPRQWAALARLSADGALSQNQLGRATAMDAATVKGVVDRLLARGLAEANADPTDQRRRVIALTDKGQDLVHSAVFVAKNVTAQTLAPLTAAEQSQLLALLSKII
jgi:DNA-binding MarR family transcriptional regulator